MIPYQEALQILRTKTFSVPTETCPLEESVGRLVAQTIESPENIPSFSNSAMDGFALRSAETAAGARFGIMGTLAAGDAPVNADDGRPNVTWEIMTGAPVPKGFDCIVKLEECARTHSTIEITRPIKSKENIRPLGEDFQQGQPVVDAGERLEPKHVLALAALGISRPAVFRRPRIAILSTGNELAGYRERALQPGKIRNSSAPYLCTELKALGMQVEYFGIAKDTPREFIHTFDRLLATGPDVVLTTGAVSVGKYDFLTTALKDLKAEILFHRVAIRPGKPILFAQLSRGGKIVSLFGLPGNPISTAVGLRFFVEPFVRASYGIGAEESIQLPLFNDVRKPAGLTCFFKSCLRIEDKVLCAESLSGQSSALISPLVSANAWVILPQEPSEVPKGTLVEVVRQHSWQGSFA